MTLMNNHRDHGNHHHAGYFYGDVGDRDRGRAADCIPLRPVGGGGGGGSSSVSSSAGSASGSPSLVPTRRLSSSAGGGVRSNGSLTYGHGNRQYEDLRKNAHHYQQPPPQPPSSSRLAMPQYQQHHDPHQHRSAIYGRPTAGAGAAPSSLDGRSESPPSNLDYDTLVVGGPSSSSAADIHRHPHYRHFDQHLDGSGGSSLFATPVHNVTADESSALLVPEERVGLLPANGRGTRVRAPASSSSSSSAGGFHASSSSTAVTNSVGQQQQQRRTSRQMQQQQQPDRGRAAGQARNGAMAGGTVGKKRPSGMAPTTTIETVTIVRPLKVIAFICGALAVFLLILCLASSEWLLAQGWRQGLFVHCVSSDAIHPLPFGISSEAGCYGVRSRGYIISSAILCIVGVVLAAAATLLTGLGLWSQDSNNKYKYYRFALYVMIGSLVSVLIALIIYPVCFSGELQHGNRDLWEFGWAYGVAWGAAIFLFGGIVLLLLDKESEEIYYKERTVVQHESQAGSDAASGSNKG